MNTKSFLIQDVLELSEKKELKPETIQRLRVIRNEDNKNPIIFVGAGTCGLGAGAGDTIRKIKAFVEARKIKAEIIPVGCIGLCSSEPIMDVKLPGKKESRLKKSPAIK